MNLISKFLRETFIGNLIALFASIFLFFASLALFYNTFPLTKLGISSLWNLLNGVSIGSIILWSWTIIEIYLTLIKTVEKINGRIKTKG